MLKGVCGLLLLLLLLLAEQGLAQLGCCCHTGVRLAQGRHIVLRTLASTCSDLFMQVDGEPFLQSMPCSVTISQYRSHSPPMLLRNISSPIPPSSLS